MAGMEAVKRVRGATCPAVWAERETVQGATGSWGQLGGCHLVLHWCSGAWWWCWRGVGGRYKEKWKAAIKTTERCASDEAGERDGVGGLGNRCRGCGMLVAVSWLPLGSAESALGSRRYDYQLKRHTQQTHQSLSSQIKPFLSSLPLGGLR